MEITCLGSSSAGNSTLIASGDTNILIDAGISAREIEKRLELMGHAPSDINAILLSHEHSDHCRGAGILSRKYDIPVRANPPTFAMSPIGNVRFEEFMTLEEFVVGDLRVQTCPVPHNAAEPVCFSISDGKHRMGFLTDLGRITKLIGNLMLDKDMLVIEANHDEEMLRRGPYPEFLKKSIASSIGHLSNRQAASAITELSTPKTREVLLVHLSEENNTPERASHEVNSTLARKFKSLNVTAAERYKVTMPIDLG